MDKNENLHDLFDYIDVDGNQYLSTGELAQEIERVTQMYMNFDIDFWFDKYDFDKNGLVERDEWEERIAELRDKHNDNFEHVQVKLRFFCIFFCIFLQLLHVSN